MEKQTKRILLYIMFGTALFAVSINLESVWGIMKNVFSLLLPVITGLIVAFVLSVPMKGFENLILRLTQKSRRKPQEKQLQVIGLLLTMISLAVVIILVFTSVIPEIVKSVKNIVILIDHHWSEWMGYLDAYGINTERITEWVASVDYERLLQTLSGSTGALLGSIMNTSASIISGIATAGIAFVISVYVLISRRSLARQGKRVLYVYVKKTYADRICHIAGRIHNTYTKFLSGQCIEAVILGVLIFLAFSMFRLPYAGLIGFLTGIFAFIPYVGAFAACAVGVLLILLTSPEKALLSIVVYLVVQFIENQFIYPNVVGTSVGLPPLWTFIAALIGGKMFGLLGMIFSIPLMSVIYSLVREDVNNKSAEK